MSKKWELFSIFVAILFGLTLGQITLFNTLAQGTSVSAPIAPPTNLPTPAPTLSGTNVSRYGIFEKTYTYTQPAVGNQFDIAPYTQVKVSAVFTTPSGKKLNVEGFYYDTDTYKLRFTPAEIGNYAYTVIITGGPGGTFNDAGSFTSISSQYTGFIRKHPTIPYKLIFDDGSAFFGIGFNDGTNNTINPSNPNATLREFIGSSGVWGHSIENTDEGGNVDLDIYFKKYAESGFTLHRFNNGPSLSLGGTLTDKINKGKQVDQLLSKAKNHGFHSMFTFFGSGGQYPNVETDPNQDAQFKQQIKYVLARLGAYVDIWEWTNEASAGSAVTDSWLTYTSNYLRSVDPYQRLITNSHPRSTDNLSLDVKSPHLYQSAPILYDPGSAYEPTGSNKTNGLPYIYGEVGYGGSGPQCTQSANSPLTNPGEEHFRSQIWTAFFGSSGLIYWNGSGSYPNCFVQYLGSIERQFNKILRDFSLGFPADATSNQLPASGGANLYALTSGTVIGIYAQGPLNTTQNRTSTFTINVPFNGTASWIDPVTGNILQTFPVTAGSQAFTTPPYTQDIALKIVSSSVTIPTPTPTPSSSDTQAPTVPTNLTAQAQPLTTPGDLFGKVDLSWSSSTDNTDVEAYRIYRDTLYLGATQVTNFQDDTAGTSFKYNYYVAAVDAAGNESAKSQAATVTVPTASSAPILGRPMSGIVFFDTNGNHIQDAGELGASGLTVTKSSATGGTSTTTDSLGNYSFPNLHKTNHTFFITPPAGYKIISGHPYGSDSAGKVPTFALAPTTATPAPTASPVITPTPAPTSTPTPQPANPSIQLTYPLQGMNAQLGSQMTLLATASSGKGVNRVEFQVNGNTICTDSAAPYACDWRVPATSATYKITAWVIDNAGSKKSATVTVTAGPNIYSIPTPTTVNILSPANNSQVVVGSKVEVRTDASDTQSGINRVVMLVNGSAICTDSNTPYFCNWIVPQGSGKNYTLAVYAITNAGNKVSQSITVTSIPNLFPTVTISNPLDGAEVAAGSWVAIKAVAQSTQSEVSRVVFHVNNSHVCTDYEAPFICNWIVPPVSGVNYTLTAWVYNKTGNRQSSSISVRSRFGY